jgi:hypothetical protein
MRYRETHSLLGAMQRTLAPLQIQHLKPHYRLQIAEQGFVVASTLPISRRR